MNWFAVVLCAPAWGLEVTAVNPSEFARSAETIELSGKDLDSLGEKNFQNLHVKDASGSEVLCQAVDNDGDDFRKPDALIFQADFAPGETKRFTVSKGTKQVYKKEQFKAFGRFNRERFDDFVWENDKIAHRTYGKALETWKGEPLTSSTIDIWSKRTPRMVVNDWYLADDYHVDHGEGADFYSAGLSRGCGGSGIWAADKLWVSGNFVKSNVLANGPIRVMFELEYAPYEVNVAQLTEVKRVTLDAGSQFDFYQSRWKLNELGELSTAAGLKKAKGEQLMKGDTWLAKWEPMEKKAGNQGLAVIVPPGTMDQALESGPDHLVVMKPAKGEAKWWAGFCWDKAGEITTADAWNSHVIRFTEKLAAPIKVSVNPSK